MEKTDVLIVGYGVVGHNLEKELALLHPAYTDKYKGIKSTNYESKKYDLCFICVDTPINEKYLCDTTEVANAINENDAEVYVIKSTVLPNTTDKLKELTGKRIVFSPEYYGGTIYCNNFNFDFTIVGGEKEDCQKVVQKLYNVYDGRHKFQIVSAKEAEIAKYMENSYLATKVIFCNEFYRLCNQVGASYENVRECFVLDPRVNPAHTFVFEDRPYYKSHCLDKDVPAIAETYDMELLKTVIKVNENFKKAL